VVELLGVLATPEIISGLGHLTKRLATLKASDAPLRMVVSRRRRSRRAGWVFDAVLRVFADQDGPMRVEQVYAAVEALPGETTSKSSVNWCLSTGIEGDRGPFVRVAGGRYALVSDGPKHQAPPS
jgi:hypothetical protein